MGLDFILNYLSKREDPNNGVLVKGEANGKNINYYDVLTRIIELQYFEGKWIVLFECDWWDVAHIGIGVKIDKHDFVSVNTKQKLVTDEPFVFASQFFYVKDHLHPSWSTVLNGHSTYFIGGAIDEDTFRQDAYNESLHICEDDKDIMNLKRNDLDVIRTDVTLVDDIIEVRKSEPETDDEDFLL
uniref:DUF4216 domain-containing protein n=1 Tax=Solanum lycopersicum TaxID=4081 RepID=A0A3Q7EZR8_SOLLC